MNLGEATGLLIVSGEAVEWGAFEASDLSVWPVLPAGTRYLLLARDGNVLGGPADELRIGLDSGSVGVPPIGEIAAIDDRLVLTRFAAGPDGESLLLAQTVEQEDAVALPAEQYAPAEAPVIENLSAPSDGEPPAPQAQEWPDELQLPDEAARRSLSSLFDRLVGDTELYAGLDEPAPPSPPGTAPENADAAPSAPEDSPTYKITGRGFEPAQDALALGDDAAPRDPEAIERVSRYNFEELSRILNDRVGADDSRNARAAPASTSGNDALVRASGATQPEGQLVSLAGETFILNRLPIGILVFRDQQVLFANRAVIEMTGHASVEELRAAGLASIFPGAGVGEEAGPITHLIQRSGMLVPVSARLQSISWQGRPALMLSASANEARTGHEAAVRAFAELFAECRQEGFIAADRSGAITHLSGRARLQLGSPDEQLAGKPISVLIDPEQDRELKVFLERPARIAETARPYLQLRLQGGSNMVLFAQGQAGIVTGYFGLLHRTDPAAPLAAAADIEPAVLARLSRGLRRPLNTIIGFADLIRTAAFGEVGNERYLEYARDIKTAGEEIAVLIDELDDFSRLREGRYTTRPMDIELAPLLESCILRVRAQAGAARVLVRTAISEKLPRIHADRASLGQAVLNLLASAIDQTPAGGSVVLSAQAEEDGSILVNVRDSAAAAMDPGERFVVFRDGVGREGQALAPVRSSVGLALTRSLLAVNAFSLSVDPVGEAGTLFSLVIPAGNVERTRAGAEPSPA